MLLVFIFSLPAQAQWNWLNPKPQGNELRAICFIDQNIGYAAGTVGTIIKTTDGGASWSIQNLTRMSIYTYFVGVYFPSPNTGFLIGHYGEIYRTQDGGNNWDSVYYEENESLSGAYFFDELNGWVTGSGGLLLRTIDGGNSWERMFTSPGYSWSAVCFTSQMKGFLVGNYGTIMQTIDGGLNWTKVISGVNTYLSSICFADSIVGYIIASQHLILKTTDGGNTWLPHPINDTLMVSLASVSAINRDTVYAIAERDSSMMRHKMVIRSTDGGNNWAYLPNSMSYDFPTVISVSQSGTLYTAGEAGCISKSDNFGNSWTSLSESQTWNEVRGIHFPTPGTGYIATGGNECPMGQILKSTDSGNNWTVIANGSNCESFNTVHFLNNSWGIIGGFKLYNTFDGGTTFNQCYDAGYFHQFRSIDFAGSIGLAVGDGGIILRSADGGQSWTTIPSGTSAPLSSVCFGGQNTAYITAYPGVLKSTDAGLNWAQVGSVSGKALWFTDAQTGYMVSDNIIYKTTDGAISWSSQSIPGDYVKFKAVRFFDLDTGYIIGGQLEITCNVMKTTDAGQSWTEQRLPSNYPLYALDISSDYKVFTGGWYGFLFGTVNGGTTSEKEPVITGAGRQTEIFPNPFSASATIRYILDKPSDVKLFVHDPLGRLIKSLFWDDQSAGTYSYTLESTGLSPGIYFCTLIINGRSETRKLILRENF